MMSIVSASAAIIAAVCGVLMSVFVRNKSSELLSDVLLVGQQVLVNHRHPHSAFLERLYDQVQIAGRCCGFEQYTDYHFM